MGVSDYIFTSESVSEGHPDKICDRISDSILDAFLALDSSARVACETLVTTNFILLAGEVRPADLLSTETMVDIVRSVVRDIGYEQDGFHWQKAEVDVRMHAQSADIARGVDSAGNHKQEGAGDQGLMFGYACRETDVLMPAPLVYAHQILFKMAQGRKSGAVCGLGPDAKSQVSLRYQDGKPVDVEAILISTQHDEKLAQDAVREIVRPFVQSTLPEGWFTPRTRFLVNPTGKFVIGGPDGDAGLTGRKIIVDTYGGAAPHGGGAFSGKDPTKVDRSAAYMARYLAKNIVAARLADKCTIQLAYAIGVSEPVAIYVDTHGTETEASPETLAQILRNPQLIDLTPRGICTHLKLDRPIYARTAAYGHFGRPPDETGGFTWEKIDLSDKILEHL